MQLYMDIIQLKTCFVPVLLTVLSFKNSKSQLITKRAVLSSHAARAKTK